MFSASHQSGGDISGLLDYQSELEKSGQRDIVVVEGDREFADAIIQSLVDDLSSVCLISNRHPAAVALNQASSCLGQEAPWVIVDLHEKLDVDALCIAAGLVTAGGILLLLWPGLPGDQQTDSHRLTVWQDNKRADYPWFESYLFESLQGSESIGSWIRQQDSVRQFQSAGPDLSATAIVDGLTADQSAFIDQARQWLSTGKPGVYLLLADRGRGKSTGLGLLCEDLLRSSSNRLLVTAASRQAAAMLLKQVPGISFIAPDALLENRPDGDLVLIDEAAMIPQSMLRQICDLYPRVILATTTGGYEGTGQGFLLRFKKSFEASRVQQYELQSPVRWCAGDRVEAWLKTTLLPQTDEAVAVDQPLGESASLKYCLLKAGDDTALLKKAYALLSSAHYRTRPSDLQMMMDNPDCRVVVAEQQNGLLGAMLLNREGELDSSLCEDIFLGRRRPKGHLLAQMVTVQTAAKEFASCRGLRIQRIAVPPQYRRQGIGSALIGQAMQLAASEGLDYLGASFALDTGSIEFWADNEFKPACLSYAQGKSSGSHSLAVLKPLSEQAVSFSDEFTKKLHHQLPGLFLTSLQKMEADHVVGLLRHLNFRTAVSQLEINDMTAFTEGERGLESCFVSLQKQVMQAIARTSHPIEPLLVYKAVLYRDWSALPRSSGSEGKRQLQQRLRGLLRDLLAAAR